MAKTRLFRLLLVPLALTPCLLLRASAGPGPVSARACGQEGSHCEILAENLASPRSLSTVQPDGSFFVGSAGSPVEDLFGEAVSGTGTDIDSSTIFRYTAAEGLQPWVTRRPSQLITVFDATFGTFVPFQAGVNGVEVMNGDLVYSVAYNRGTTNYVDRMRSFTAETGITFAEVRRIAGGASDPNGPETTVADLARAELDFSNPDGIVFPVDNLTHKAGDRSSRPIPSACCRVETTCSPPTRPATRCTGSAGTGGSSW